MVSESAQLSLVGLVHTAQISFDMQANSYDSGNPLFWAKWHHERRRHTLIVFVIDDELPEGVEPLPITGAWWRGLSVLPTQQSDAVVLGVVLAEMPTLVRTGRESTLSSQCWFPKFSKIRFRPAGLSPDETGRKFTHDLREAPHGAGVAAAASIISFEHGPLLNGTFVALVVGKHKPGVRAG